MDILLKRLTGLSANCELSFSLDGDDIEIYINGIYAGICEKDKSPELYESILCLTLKDNEELKDFDS